MRNREWLEKQVIMDERKEQFDKFRKEKLPCWEKNLNTIFNSSIPEYYEWRDINDICRILNIIGAGESTNHLFFDDGGGDELKDNSKIINKIFLILSCNLNKFLIQPYRLIFRILEQNLEWSYFRLECEDIIEPNNIKDPVDKSLISTTLYEDLYLTEENRFKFDVENGTQLIFPQCSNFNHYIDDYSGKQNKMRDLAFKIYLETFLKDGLENKERYSKSILKYQKEIINDDSDVIYVSRITHNEMALCILEKLESGEIETSVSEKLLQDLDMIHQREEIKYIYLFSDREQLHRFASELLLLISEGKNENIEMMCEQIEAGTIVDYFHDKYGFRKKDNSIEALVDVNTIMQNKYVSVRETQKKQFENNGITYLVRLLLDALVSNLYHTKMNEQDKPNLMNIYRSITKMKL